MYSRTKAKAAQRAEYERSMRCAKRPKGIDADRRRRMTDTQVSHQPHRCQSSGGPSGKSNNGGHAPKYERGGVFTSPPRKGKR